MPGFKNTRDKGNYGEQLALNYLSIRGLEMVKRNFSCRFGEIDLIMLDGTEWVFVEVRFRRTNDFGGGLESVTRSKQRRLINTAEHYIQVHYKNNFDACRFDIIEISGGTHKPTFNWVKDAFWTN
jgi:putative endonuclease